MESASHLMLPTLEGFFGGLPALDLRDAVADAVAGVLPAGGPRVGIASPKV